MILPLSNALNSAGPMDEQNLPTILNNLSMLVHDRLTPRTILPKDNINELTVNKTFFSLYHQNVRSFNKHHDELNEFLDCLNVDFSVIALTETWISDQTFQNLAIFQRNNYKLELNCRGSRGGGVGAYIDLNLNYKILNINIPDSESLWFQFKLNNVDIVLGIIYRPSTITNSHEFLVGLDRVLYDMNTKNLNCVLCGDFNLDMLKLDITDQYVQSLLNYGFGATIVYPTRTVGSSCTLLDHINTNISDTLVTAGIIYNDISDHDATFALFHNIYLDIHQINTKFFPRYNFKLYNKSKFLQELNECSLNDIFSHDDPNDAFSVFISKFKACCDNNLIMHNKLKKNLCCVVVFSYNNKV